MDQIKSIETRKLNDVEPLGYLADCSPGIIDGHPNRRIGNLLPWAHIRSRTSRPWPENGASSLRRKVQSSKSTTQRVGEPPGALSACHCWQPASAVLRCRRFPAGANPRL
ncbi:transposase domain-containing protein [Mesorhizobium shangrilense]|uniref:transposase domain-containing protein n=1 Tax=Mesorhizobium shangrilense TaxID=460060 RepID=UPI003F492637